MRRLPRFALRVVLPLMLVAPRTAAPADEPPRLKTQVVKLKLAADKPSRGRPPAIELVQLPPGKITLHGADGKGRDFEIKPIWVAQYETRWDEYNVFWLGLDLSGDGIEVGHKLEAKWRQWFHTGRNSPQYPPWGAADGAIYGYPADCIHFRAARTYCAWLSENTGRKFRMPTEAEWEYACRAGGPALRPDAKALGKLAWFAENSDDHPHPVGKKEANVWGLYDMLGNVGEYVIRDPKDEKGLLAGGSYEDDAAHVHSAAREPYTPDWQKRDPEDPKRDDWLDYGSTHHVGFRVVMEE